ncbi:MAG: VWA domain-containing protein [Chloroflexota bacterium]
MTAPLPLDERQRRWRLVLGNVDDPRGDGGVVLGSRDAAMDAALAALYNGDEGEERRGSLAASAPKVARWLGDIREYFPSSVVRVMQQDAFTRLGLRQMLLEPELLSEVEADVGLVATLISLRGVMPEKAKETARIVIRKVVDELQERLATITRRAILGSLDRASRTTRPRPQEIDWHRTIRRNLRHYQPEYRTIVPETLIGHGRKRSQLRDIVLCIDQSGSMGSSVVYSSVFGAALASLPAVSTKLVAFDTAVVDLSEHLADPVDVLFGIQLGGGTDINQALGYSQTLIERPDDTILVLISDLYEGGDRAAMVRRTAAIVSSGVQMIALLALSDDGAPSFDGSVAAELGALGVPAFACTPDLFPELMAAAIQRSDIGQWAAARDISTAAPVTAP